MENFGEKFLHERDSSLHTSEVVEKTQARLKAKGEAVSQKPADKIAAYLERFKDILNPKQLEKYPGFDRKERNLNFLRKRLFENVIIKPEEVPESYFDNQRRLAREQGYGDIEITDELRRQSIEIIIADQKSTLNSWIDYFVSPDSDGYPTWVKYWAFTGMLKLSTFDKEKHAFGKRKQDTIAPFPDINREALAYVLDAIIKRVKKENIALAEDDPKFKKLLKGANFGKLYAWAIEKAILSQESELTNTAGEWIKYGKGSDHVKLATSLEGCGTGWCIAGKQTAQFQLQQGDFYVYYSYDKKGNPTIPRLVIRMEGHNKIAERPRGIGPDQNLDPYITPVLKEKLKDFGIEGEKYQKRVFDMDILTKISRKNELGDDLSIADLRFLYEFDDKIQGFGYTKDPRIKEIIAKRNIKDDIAQITGFSKNEISLTKKEAIKGGIKYHYGNLYLGNLASAEGLDLPQSIGGDFYLGLASSKGLKLPQSIGGSLNLKSLTSAKGLKLPQSIGGSLYLGRLTSAEGSKLPQSIGGSLYLESLASAEGLDLPQSIGGSFYLGRLTSSEGLKLPQSIGGDLNLRGLTSAEGLDLPQSIGGSLYLGGLTSTEGLNLPQSIGGSLYLESLASAKGLDLPQSIGGDLNLRGLTSAEGLDLPQSIGGSLILESLASAKGLKLPQSIGGSLYLGRITSAEGLNLPQSIGGSLIFESLASAKGLKLPQSIGGSLDLGRLTSAEGLKLPQSIGGDLNLEGLTSAEGLDLPQSIGGSLYLEGLISTEGLKLPQSIGGDLNLKGLTSAEGLDLPQSIDGDLNLRGLTSAEGLNLPQSIGGCLYLGNLTLAEKEILRSKHKHLVLKII